ncbi:MAG: hypothetical protein K2L86_13315 [Lachnospiraceae bacterium]|nr:hypothetical protein [Lachnospiraceae bacterium]
MELLILLIILAAVFLYVMIRGALDEKNQKRKYRRQLKEMYGSFPDRTYSAEELDKISRYYWRKREISGLTKGTYGNDIDEITWNDLGMDSIFARINFAQSSSGEEYLYAMLRHPVTEDREGAQAQMSAQIDYMMEHEKERLDTMMSLRELGHTGKYALSDYLDYLKELGVRSNKVHYVCILLMLISIIVIFVRTSLGVPMVIATACFNIVTYMKEKGIAAPYVTTFAYIIRMLHCADEIAGHSLGAEMETYAAGLRAKRSGFKDFERHSGMVLKMNASTGNIDELLFDYIKMLTHVDLIRFNKMLNIVHQNKDAIIALSEDIGYIDAVISIGYFRAALPYYCTPLLQTGCDSRFVISEGFHPCIENPVANSFSQHRGMIITGSNASGKSTFLKMTAINAILAQTVYTCAAKMYKGNYYRISSSMSLRDNLDNGESYYIVEIKALKRIIDAADAKDAAPLLCFVDEVLRGTNTVERIAASTQILKRLAQKGIYCFAATHDIELTHLLEQDYENCHFEEEVKHGDVLFSYRLLEGRAHTRNAIKLLEIIGFSRDIIRKADDMAGAFLRTGEWEAI